MNAVVDTPADAPRPSGASPVHRTHRFRWLLRREFWEHKGGFFWAPLITGAVFLLFTLIGGGTGQYMFERHGGKVINVDGHEVALSEMNWGELLSKASPDELRQLHDVINGSTLVSATWPVLVFGVVVFFYLLGCLYDERKDRSVLFWKSLPVSDRDTVLSKLATALLVGPLLASLIGIATMIGFGVIVSLFILLNGANPFTLYWGQLDFFSLLGTMFGWIPLYALWALPTAGWLMLCSAWAKSKPFLWAIVLPVGAGLLVSWFGLFRMFEGGASWFWEHVVARALSSAWPGSHLLGYVGTSYMDHLDDTPDALFGFEGMLVGSHLLATPALWIGAVAGVAMILVAIRLRRWRDEG